MTAGPTAHPRDTTNTVSGIEPPHHTQLRAGPGVIERTFAFLDLCGSTRFLEHHGASDTWNLLTFLRAQIRDVAASRGVRVAKWLGDGAMLVGVDSGPVIAASVELVERSHGLPIPLRGGVSVSAALLLDGDDYVGRGANFAARLCEQAQPFHILCDTDCRNHLPTWVSSLGEVDVDIKGMGQHPALTLVSGHDLRDLWWRWHDNDTLPDMG